MLPPKVRQLIYIVTALTSPVVIYLGNEGRLDTFWVGLFSVVVTAVTGLAASNVNTDEA